MRDTPIYPMMKNKSAGLQMLDTTAQGAISFDADLIDG